MVEYWVYRIISSWGDEHQELLYQCVPGVSTDSHMAGNEMGGSTSQAAIAIMTEGSKRTGLLFAPNQRGIYPKLVYSIYS